MAAAALPITDSDVCTLAGVSELAGEPGFTAIERVGARPTAEVNGMGGGYQGEGTKTVLPREAFAKLTFRLVPNQEGDEILNLATHTYARCPKGVRLTFFLGIAASLLRRSSSSTEGPPRALELWRKPARCAKADPSLHLYLQKVSGRPLLLAPRRRIATRTRPTKLSAGQLFAGIVESGGH
jgi:acetylornithine deacetylase/succinyl-diaminopimelate desuccinylase-like protein